MQGDTKAMQKCKDRLFSFPGIKFREDTPPAQQLYRQNLMIAWPATIEGALLSIISSIDTMMVGTLGPAAIAAVGLTAQPRMILVILAQALCTGTTAVIARRKGAGDQQAANACLTQSMYVVTILGVCISLLGYFFAEPLMRFAGANADTLEMATQYFQIIALGLTLNCWNMCICAAMRAIGKTTITMTTNITANVVNVILNYCLIGGHFGCPALGVRGAAIATVCGTAVATVIAFVFACSPGRYLRMHFSFPPKFDKETMGSLIKVGSGSIAESVFLRIGFLVNSKLIAGVGTSAFAAYQIVSQVTSLSFTLGDGIATAGTTMVGQSLGAKRPDLAQAHVAISRRLALIVSIALMVIVFVFRRYIGMLFTDDAVVLDGVSMAFIAAVAGIIGQNGRVVYAGCLRGAGDVKYVAMCSLISVALLRPICTWLFCYPLDSVLPMLKLTVTGPWIAFAIDAYLRQTLLSRRIQRGDWLQIRL